MSIEITVVICTYNRAELLEGALVSLCTQAVSTSCFEILVIDNGSTDNTVTCVQDCQQRYPNHNLRMYYEARQGLGLARNTAIEQSHGRYIAYLDDDAMAETDWVAQALATLRERSEELVCIGGPYRPFYAKPAPLWFKDEYEIRSWGAQARWLKAGESFSGSNMIWSRESLLAIDGFSEQVGVKGDILSLGEESDAFNKVWQQLENPRLYYVPSLVIRHWVPAFKMKVFYHLKRAFMAGQVAVKLNNQPDRSLQVIVKHMMGVLSHGIIAIRQYRSYPHWQNWAIEAGGPVLNKVGVLLATIGIFVRVKQK